MTKTKTENHSPSSKSDGVPPEIVQAGLTNLADMAASARVSDQGPGEPTKKERKKYTKRVPQDDLFEPAPLAIDPKITGQILVVIGGIVARARHDENWKPIETEVVQFGTIMNGVLGRYLPDPAKTHKELVALFVFCLGYTMQRVTKKSETKTDSTPEHLEII